MKFADSVHFEKYNLDEADVELQEGLSSSINNAEIHKCNFLLFRPGETKKVNSFKLAYPSTVRPITQLHEGPNRLLKAVTRLSETSAKSV